MPASCSLNEKSPQCFLLTCSMFTTDFSTFYDPKYQRFASEEEEDAILTQQSPRKDKHYLDRRNDVAIGYLLSCRFEKGIGHAFKNTPLLTNSASGEMAPSQKTE